MNICPKQKVRFSAGILFTIAGIFLLCLAGNSFALDPNRAIFQYREDRWGTERGFSGGTIYSISQSSDGFLWIATEKGLVRFDGLNFELLSSPETPNLPAGSVFGLTADPDGNLWVRPQIPSVLRYRNGEFENVLTNLERIEPRITAMSRGKNGEVIISTLENGILRFDGEKFITIAAKSILPDAIIISLAETPDGEIWFGTRDVGLFQVKDNKITAFRENLPDLKINCLLTEGTSDLLIGTDKGLIRRSENGFTKSGIPPELEKTQILTILKDRDENIWIGTDSKGLVRLKSTNSAITEFSETAESEAVTALFEDREGNLWIGSDDGIRRLRESAFLTYENTENTGSIFVNAENKIWIAPLSGGFGFIKNNEFEKLRIAGISDDIVYSISGGKNNLWLGLQRGGLTNLRFEGESFTTKTYTKETDGLAQNSVFAVHQAADETVWAGTLSGGVSRFKNGEFTNYTTADGLISNTINAIAESADGTIWFATPNGLSGFKDETWQNFTAQNGLVSETVNCLFTDETGGIWIGSSKGLSFLSNGQIRSFADNSNVLQENILGIAADKNGSIWISTSNNILQLSREKLLSGTLTDADIRRFDFDDGLISTEGVKRQKTVTVDASGRVLFSLKRGISAVDPERLRRNSAPVIVQIQTISADGIEFNSRNTVSICSSNQKITFSFAGLNLSVPERVRFRFMLEGFDTDWSHPTANREAVYTNLKPGSYNFRVIAGNNDGIWNGAERVVKIEIAPVFWQTWWFRIFCLLILIGLVFAVYRIRLLRLTRNLDRRFEERLAERMTIAQELHDSLLQGMVSASMQLNVAVDKLPPDTKAKPQLDRVLELMGEVIEEGRNTVSGLRSIDNNFINLEQAFSQIPQNLRLSEKIEFQVVVEGNPLLLYPAIRDEIYLIGREAIINAFRHSKAKKIEVELLYGARQLKILIRDNGIGINPQIIQTGRDGHFGLAGMKERAEKIGVKLKVYSNQGAGTEVEILVPNRIAFEPNTFNRRFKWLKNQVFTKNTNKAVKEKGK